VNRNGHTDDQVARGAGGQSVVARTHARTHVAAGAEAQAVGRARRLREGGGGVLRPAPRAPGAHTPLPGWRRPAGRLCIARPPRNRTPEQLLPAGPQVRCLGYATSPEVGMLMVRRPLCPFWRPVLTEIYLCGVCSCQEILRRNGRGQVQELCHGGSLDKLLCAPPACPPLLPLMRVEIMGLIIIRTG
jgi:hypothetical protein